MSLVKEIALIFVMKIVLFLMRKRVYIDCSVYKCEREGDVITDNVVFYRRVSIDNIICARVYTV